MSLVSQTGARLFFIRLEQKTKESVIYGADFKIYDRSNRGMSALKDMSIERPTIKSQVDN